MQLLKRLIATLFVLAILFAGAIFVIAFAFQDELKASGIKSINKHLNSEISTASIDVDAFKKFPFISLKLKNVFAKDVLSANDTLFYFEEAYLQFNIIDIINKTYTLREISLEKGKINIKTDKNNNYNYDIIKKSDDSENSEAIKLEKVYFNEALLTYFNEKRGDKLNLYLNDTYLKGEFEKKSYELDLYGNIDVNNILIDNTSYLKEKTTQLDLGLNINTESNIYQFTRGNLTIDKTLDFKIVGSITNNEHILYNLSINSEKLDISNSFSLLPYQIAQHLTDYNSDGVLNFKTTILSDSKSSSPEIKSEFTILNGTLVDKKHNLQFELLNCTGTHSNRGYFQLTNVSTTIGEGHLKGNFSIKNFKKPTVSIDAECDLTFSHLLQLLKIDTLQNVEGKIKINSKLSGPINDLSNITFNDFENLTSSGNIELEKATFNIKGNNKTYESINANLSLKGNDVKITELNGKIGKTDFELQGYFNNALSYLFLENQRLGIAAKYHSNFVDLNEYVSTDESSELYKLKLPENVFIRLKADIDSLVFRAFHATDIKGTISLRNQQVIIEPLSMNCMDGILTGEGMLNAKNGKEISIKTNCELKKISITELFTQFENFGQQTLTSQHLKGNANVEINYSMLMDSTLTIDPKTIISSVKLDIENGELVEFKPLIETADYIKNNKLLRKIVKPEELSQRLKHIKFKTLTNTIHIKDEIITIPKMDIQSSAMDITFEGQHTFNNEIDYNMNFYLSDLLTTDEAERNIKGKTRIFLHMSGTVDNPTITYDKAAAKEGVKEEVQSEKKEVKTIMKEEFGLFSKDTSIKSTYTPPEKLDFTIEWEEDNNKDKSSIKTPDEDKKKGLKNFLKGNDKPKNDVEDFDFDDGDF